MDGWCAKRLAEGIEQFFEGVCKLVLASEGYPGMPFGHGMTVPLELTLRKVEDQIRLCFYPIEELKLLREQSYFKENISSQQANQLFRELALELFDVSLTFKTQDIDIIRIDLGGHPVLIDSRESQVSFENQTAQIQSGKDGIHIRLLIDRSVTEVFIDHGWCAFSAITIFDESKPQIHIDGQAVVETLEVHALKSIWN